ncbi:MAG TPA: ABC transporter substrate-binding protein [Rhodobacteraceae bacterium]|nr:ABC transporter substrate-binding protein [Paracoccaceae bacterium]
MPGALMAQNQGIRFGVTPAFLHDQHAVLEKWRRYLIRRMDQKITFIRRDSYRETMDLIRLNQLDFAWICDYPFLELKNAVKLLVVPLYKGRPAYRSYLIVNAKDTVSNGYADLRGKIFAYADPYSNTGFLAPRYEIQMQGDDPEHYFRKTFFTWSHRKVIEAVASGLAHAGAVDSYVWDSLERVEPELTGRTRIIWRSPEHGFPPLVAHTANVNDNVFRKLQKILLGMSSDPEGQEILAKLGLDGFSIQKRELYNSVADMMRLFGEYAQQ